MYTNPDNRTPWQQRAERVGFHVWEGRKVQDMTDAEIEAAFEGLARVAGIHYIPRVPPLVKTYRSPASASANSARLPSQSS